MDLLRPSYKSELIPRFFATLCILLILLAKATVAQETIGLYFYVIAPQTKTDGTPWEPGVAGGLPDIFVCFRATTRRWDCAPPCQDSRTCAGKLNVVPVDKPLTIGVFDRDIQQNDPMYNLNIENARRCTSGDENPCRFAYEGRIAVTFSHSPVPETLQDESCTQFSIIFLHGKGDSGKNWKTTENNNWWNLPAYVDLNFPTGPIPFGKGYNWYNIDEDGNIDEDDVENSEDLIKGYIQQQMEEWDIPSGCIVLAGHSQGGAMALHTGLRSEQNLLGILTLTASMRSGTPFGDQTETWKADKSIPIFMSHGTCDDYKWSGIQRGVEARELIISKGYNVHWVDVPRAHNLTTTCLPELTGGEVVQREMEAIRAWLSPLLESRAFFNGASGK